MTKFAVPTPSTWHKTGGTVAGATMWLWIMYRMKQDGDVLFVCETLREMVQSERLETNPSSWLKKIMSSRDSTHTYGVLRDDERAV